MKTIIVSTLGILFCAAQLASAQSSARARSQAYIQWAIAIKQQMEAEQRAYENSPDSWLKEASFEECMEMKADQPGAPFFSRESRAMRSKCITNHAIFDFDEPKFKESRKYSEICLTFKAH
jgi:hypothetical protein